MRSSSRPAPRSSTRSARATGSQGLSPPGRRGSMPPASTRDGGRHRDAAGRGAVHAVAGQLVRFEGDDAVACAPSSRRRRDRRGDDDAVRHRDPRPRSRAARHARADGRRGAASAWSAPRGRRLPLPPPPTDGRRLPVHGHDRRRPRRTRGTAASPSWSCSSAPSLAVPRHVPGRRVPAARPVLDRRPDRRGPGAVHRPTGRAPDHAGRGRRRRLRRRLPTDAAPRRAPRARRADGPVRWLVAAVALRRCGRRVLGGARGRVDRRRQHARQARRVAGRTSSSSRAAVSVPRRGHPARAARATRCCSTSAATSWTTG